MVNPLQAAMGVILVIIALWVVVLMVEALDTSTWSSLLSTIVGTLLPAIIGIGGIFLALRGFGVIGGRGMGG